MLATVCLGNVEREEATRAVTAGEGFSGLFWEWVWARLLLLLGLNMSLPLEGSERPPLPGKCGTSNPSNAKPCFVATISEVGEYGKSRFNGCWYFFSDFPPVYRGNVKLFGTSMFRPSKD